MKGAKEKIGAAGSNLIVAVKPGRGEGAARQLDAEDDAGGHVLEEAGVHAHDFDVADAFGIEGVTPANAPVSVVKVRLAVGIRTITPQSLLKL